jgi:SAM-dependent methyltransferase
MLTSDALEEIAKAFTDPAACFVHSNDAEFEDGTWQPRSYSAYWGWVERPWEYQGHALIEQVAMPSTAQALRAIFWAPNHVRAWRALDYWKIGGHNPELGVVDDYDLCCRFYLHAPLTWIDQCLYLYRRYAESTTIRQNAAIREGNGTMYTQYVIPMAETWARREKLALIDLGGGFSKPEGYTSLDVHDADILCGLEQGIPLPDNSVGVVRAYDVLEHLHDSVAIMNEIYRVLAPGGWLLASVPSTDGRGAFQAPDHVTFWNENSFSYYTDPAFAHYVRRITCKFQASRVITWFPSEWHRQRNISYVDAQLIAVKDGYRPIGECLWSS